jgi:hypothetical protein
MRRGRLRGRVQPGPVQAGKPGPRLGLLDLAHDRHGRPSGDRPDPRRLVWTDAEGLAGRPLSAVAIPTTSPGRQMDHPWARRFAPDEQRAAGLGVAFHSPIPNSRKGCECYSRIFGDTIPNSRRHDWFGTRRFSPATGNGTWRVDLRRRGAEMHLVSPKPGSNGHQVKPVSLPDLAKLLEETEASRWFLRLPRDHPVRDVLVGGRFFGTIAGRAEREMASVRSKGENWADPMYSPPGEWTVSRASRFVSGLERM